MNTEEITHTLKDLFGETVSTPAPNSWQVKTANLQLLVLLSDDESWLRILLPIAPAADAKSFLEPILEANFDTTQETRYALHQNVLWGVFQHNFKTLNIVDFSAAIQQLLSMLEKGIDNFFSKVVEAQISQIIKAAKQQGHSLEATWQNIERFYAEGVMGEIDMEPEHRQKTLVAWRYQLERLWPKVD